ncbi:MAG TPA: hypothetical protein VFF28_05605 [Candidatus Nanoarchaeia archaeon]|nr:hypothetical protein [Candidatus Nanoarchaeia archaeon]
MSKLGNNRVAVTALEVMANVHTESTDYVVREAKGEVLLEGTLPYI